MIKRADPEAIAVAEPDHHQDLAQAVAEEQLRQRRQAMHEDLLLWRDIVVRVANGQQPTQAMLKQLGELGHRLSLPPDALSTAVQALKAERTIDEQLAASKARLSELAQRDKQLRHDLEQARQQVRSIEGEIMDYQRVAGIIPELARQRQEHHASAPMMFRPVDVCLDAMLKREHGMGTDMLKGLQQQAWVTEGHMTKSSWS